MHKKEAYALREKKAVWVSSCATIELVVIFANYIKLKRKIKGSFIEKTQIN